MLIDNLSCFEVSNLKGKYLGSSWNFIGLLGSKINHHKTKFFKILFSFQLFQSQITFKSELKMIVKLWWQFCGPRPATRENEHGDGEKEGKFDEKHEYGCSFLISWYGPIRSKQNSPIWHPCPGIAAKIIRQVTSHCQIINIQHRNSIWISTLWRFILFQFFQFVKIEEFLILKNAEKKSLNRYKLASFAQVLKGQFSIKGSAI